MAGFKLNSHDTCVSNRMVNRKQKIIFCHGENCKVSHVDPKVIYNFIEVVKQDYKSIFDDVSGNMTVNCDEIHKYLGMIID